MPSHFGKDALFGPVVWISALLHIALFWFLIYVGLSSAPGSLYALSALLGPVFATGEMQLWEMARGRFKPIAVLQTPVGRAIAIASLACCGVLVWVTFNKLRDRGPTADSLAAHTADDSSTVESGTALNALKDAMGDVKP